MRFVDPTGHAAGDLFDPRTYFGGTNERAGAWQGFKSGYFDAAVEQGQTFTGLGKGAYGAAKGAVTGVVGLGVTATRLQMGAVQGAAQFALTGDPSKLHEVASEATAIGSAVKNEIATTVTVAAEAYTNPSLALDAATELGIEGTAEVLGGATFETATIVAGPKGAGATARVVKEGARRARTTLAATASKTGQQAQAALARAGTRVRTALQSEVKVVPQCGVASCGGVGGFPKIKLVSPKGRVAAPAKQTARLYEVDTAYNLRKNPAHGRTTSTIAEHSPQTKWARDLVPEHSSVNKVGREPAIRVTETEASAITFAETITQVPAAARDALAIKIRILRHHTNAPRSALRELIELNKRLHPWDYRPIHREIIGQ